MEHLVRAHKRTKILKYIFLSAGICVLIAIIAILWAKNNSYSAAENEKAGQEKTKLSKEYTLGITRSIFEGVSDDLLPYKISAKSVKKDLSNRYFLNDIKGKYSLEDGDVLLNALKGTLDDDNKYIILENNVKIIFDDITLKSDNIKFNLDSKNAQSDSEVIIDFKDSNIRADGFETENSGDKIKLEGNVESNFKLEDF